MMFNNQTLTKTELLRAINHTEIKKVHATYIGHIKDVNQITQLAKESLRANSRLTLLLIET